MANDSETSSRLRALRRYEWLPFNISRILRIRSALCIRSRGREDTSRAGLEPKYVLYLGSRADRSAVAFRVGLRTLNPSNHPCRLKVIRLHTQTPRALTAAHLKTLFRHSQIYKHVGTVYRTLYSQAAMAKTLDDALSQLVRRCCRI